MKPSHIALAVCLAGVVTLTRQHPARGDVPASPSPQVQDSLPRMIDCEWSAAPALPFGLQDNDGGVIDNHLIMVGGFCGGADSDWKQGKYIRGFFNDAYALNLQDESQGWKRIANFPGIPRQEMHAAAVNNQLYVWGGFSYTAPYTFQDGYRLARDARSGHWRWSPLPDLPWRLSTGGVCTIGTKIYIFGGGDYDAQRFNWDNDRTGTIPRLGARLIVFDTKSPDAGWKELAQCPGTTRMQGGTAAVGGKIYVIGGYAGSVDSWVYDPQTDTWSRRRDVPVSCGGFGAGLLTFKDRYVLLATGYMSATVRDVDGSTRPGYGTGSQVERKRPQHPNLTGARFYNHLWVYDTETDLFGTATPLPYEDHAPPTYVIGDTVYMFGDETGGFYWKDEYFGHHPEFVLKGRMKETDWED